jgi:hypothetical protein
MSARSSWALRRSHLRRGLVAFFIASATSPVFAGTLTISPSTLPNPSENTPYSETVTASGGVGPYTFSIITNSNPALLSCSMASSGSSGTINCTPAAGQTGTATITIQATDSALNTGTQNYFFTVLARSSTATTLTSSQNPSSFGAPVTFTATVTGTSSPTGSVTFEDGATVLGSGTLDGAGHATFTTSSLSIGTHAITAVYFGDANNATSASGPLMQAVGIAADSVRLRTLQIVVTKLEAQGSGQAIAGATDNAIADGFASGGGLVTANDSGMHFNFAAEPQATPTEQRVQNVFSALGYAPGDVFMKAPPRAPAPDWLAWADIRGTGWTTNQQTGDIRGGQINALLGITRKVTPDFLVGVLGGYENFDYTSQLLNGRLKGDGWTIGAYLGWRVMPGVRLDAGVTRSGIAYDGLAGNAAATFPGDRWLANAGLTGLYRTSAGFEIEPSARLFLLWERDDAYTDSLGTAQSALGFFTGRASVGAKVAYPIPWSGAMLTPYLGLYSDYYFNGDEVAVPAAPLVILPSEFVQGWSARVDSGLAARLAGGTNLSIGVEVGGLGRDQFTTWTARGRVAVPF